MEYSRRPTKSIPKENQLKILNKIYQTYLVSTTLCIVMPLTHVVITVKPLLLAHNHRVLWSYQFQKQYPKLILYHLCTSIYQWNGFCYFSAPQEEEETESDEGKYIEPKRLLHWLTCNCQPSKSLSMTLFHFYTYNMPRKYLQRYLSFMRRIKMSPVDAPHKCWVMRVSMFSWILTS